MSGLAIGRNLGATLYGRVFKENQSEVGFKEKGVSLFKESAFRDFVQVPSLPKSSWSIIETIASLWKSFISYFRSFFDSRYTDISVKNEDTFDAAAAEVRLGRKVLVLNFASTEEPGGGFNEGHKGGQEEDLCRRSDLGAMMLYIKEVKQLEAPLSAWNLNRQIVYTPSVKVFRANEKKNYEQLGENSFSVGVLSCGALPKPPVKSSLYAREQDREQMKTRIYTQLFIAEQEKYETLILGAFGCGAFGNPPEEVAKLYRSIIQNYFSKSFKNVTFAILNDLNQTHRNFDIFKRVLG